MPAATSAASSSLPLRRRLHLRMPRAPPHLPPLFPCSPRCRPPHPTTSRKQPTREVPPPPPQSEKPSPPQQPAAAAAHDGAEAEEDNLSSMWEEAGDAYDIFASPCGADAIADDEEVAQVRAVVESTPEDKIASTLAEPLLAVVLLAAEQCS